MTRNTFWAFVGNSVYAVCQWIVFVLLVRALGLEDVGVFAYAIAVAGPIFVLANVRLRNLLATDARSSADFWNYLAARLLTTAGAVLISLVIGAFALPGARSLLVLALIISARACDAISDICHGLFQRELEMRSAAIGLIVNGVLSVALVLLSLTLSPSLIGATAGYAAGSCLALVGWDLPRRARFVGSVRTRPSARQSLGSGLGLIATAVPLGVSSAIGNVQTNLPRYVIASYLGPGALAVFAAVSYVPMIGHLGVNAASQAALPMLAREAQTSRQRYRTRLWGLVASSIAFGALAMAATILLGRPVLRLIYGEEYAQYVGVLLWLVASAVVTFISVFLGTGTTARLRFGTQLVISTTSLVVVAACIVPLVRGHGLKGAAWALLAGAVVELCAYAAVTMRDLSVAGPASGIVPAALPDGARP